MSKTITFIVPAINGDQIQGVKKWVESLPELLLIGNVRVIPVPWEEEHAGSVTDWLSTVQQITEFWSDTDGFVIWAPGHALLELAGSLRLMIQQPGKPLIVFAADKPKQVLSSKSKLFGLKSTLINASYLALSNLAEVLVLSEGQIYRPQQCGWGKQVKTYELTSALAPIATIDFKLTILGTHQERTQKKIAKDIPSLFSSNVRFMQWFPGVQMNSDQITSDDQAVIMTNAEFWGHPEVINLQLRLQKQGVPTIWYSQQPWSKKIEFGANEIAVTHDQPWWVSLVSQFSFGNTEQTKKAFSIIQSHCE